MGDGQTRSQDDLDSLSDQANGNVAGGDMAPAKPPADAPPTDVDTAEDGAKTGAPAEIEALLVEATGEAARPKERQVPPEPVIEQGFTDTVGREDGPVDRQPEVRVSRDEIDEPEKPAARVNIETVADAAPDTGDMPTPSPTAADARSAPDTGNGSPLRSTIAGRIQSVVTKLRAAGQSIQKLQHERDEARARLNETLELNERLSRQVREEQETRQAQDNQLQVIEDELGRLRGECQALAEEGTGREAALSVRIEGLEEEKTQLAVELREAHTANAELEEQMARLREAHSRMAQRSDQLEVAVGKMQQNNRELSRALEQAEKVIASAADQQRFSEAVADAFGEIETSLESLQTR